ncbi:hypothetical protein C4564_01545 [Candidatus Microgenomates bacterium]|nr:MAG: hypothetical protein C4564_01545 [Candidatus Microgenomates bacterium]
MTETTERSVTDFKARLVVEASVGAVAGAMLASNMNIPVEQAALLGAVASPLVFGKIEQGLDLAKKARDSLSTYTTERIDRAVVKVAEKATSIKSVRAHFDVLRKGPEDAIEAEEKYKQMLSSVELKLEKLHEKGMSDKDIEFRVDCMVRDDQLQTMRVTALMEGDEDSDNRKFRRRRSSKSSLEVPNHKRVREKVSLSALRLLPGVAKLEETLKTQAEEAEPPKKYYDNEVQELRLLDIYYDRILAKLDDAA